MSDQPVKRKKGGKQPGAGRPKGSGLGVRLAPATRERIRGAMIVRRMEQIALGEVSAEPHEVTAGLGLLKFQLPTLQATDLTSKGESLVVERTVFKR
jgi:hypothetical protein